MNLEKDNDKDITRDQAPVPDEMKDQTPVPDEMPATPPEVKREIGVEEEWAETLGMDFDPEQAKKDAGHSGNEAQQPPRYNGLNQGQQPWQQPPMQGQPPMMPPIRREPMPPTYLVWSIIATLCCCLPAGIAAIIFSASVSSKYYAADYEGARRASRQAEIWIIISIVAGIVANALYLPLTLLMPS